ncbi:MAG: archaellin/type IV pilin N-terminal domain-containing protein [Nanoarchaeota archaeon]
MKRGVSPLIATVLLIGFTIAIGVIVYLWYGNIVKEQAEKQSALSEIRSDCATGIAISVNDACLSSGNILKVTVRNEKNLLIHGIRVRLNGDISELKTEKEALNGLEEKQIDVRYNDEVGTINNIEVMPLIVRQGVAGTCSEQLVKYDTSNIGPC